jgi:dihydroorotate dehydrogenase electron transfer subunit
MPKFQEQALILSQQQVARATYRMRLQSPLIAGSGQAGQFVLVRILDSWDPLLRRPFSFHRLFPQEGVIELLYRIVGRGTLLLSQCRAGTQLNLIGPLGNGFRLPMTDRGPVLLMAGGIGIAPLCELIVQLLDGGRDPATVHLLYGARSAEDLLSAAEFQSYGIPVTWSTDDGSAGVHGLVTEQLVKILQVAGPEPSVLYACGPLAMQYHVARLTLAHHLPAQLSLESLMACGVGACLGCALPTVHPDDPRADHYVHVCKDGPIFSPEAIQWHKIQYHRTEVPILAYS